MLVRKTSTATLPLTRFRGLARVPEKRARVPGVAHPRSRQLEAIND